jgi:hypothetical protein
MTSSAPRPFNCTKNLTALLVIGSAFWLALQFSGELIITNSRLPQHPCQRADLEFAVQRNHTTSAPSPKDNVTPALANLHES